MRVMKHALLSAGLIGGAMMLSGSGPASAATIAPALVQPGDTGAVQTVHQRQSYYGGQRWSYPGYGYSRHPGYGYSRHYRRSGPSIGFGLSVPGFSVGVGVPSYYGQSYGYYPYDYRYRYGRISR